MSELVVADLSKCYKRYASPRARLVELLTGRPRHEPHWALKPLSFSVGAGQSVGIIGNNGAGKSTLLKLITGTLRPTTGEVRYTGRLTAILELGAGFHPEFSGRDNLFFAGALMGIPEAEIAARVPEIIAFSELGEFIDQPVKSYSSGMFVRLAFALVTSVEPDILIVDEALAVGDQQFQKKCIDRMVAFRDRGCTILFCSHSMHHVGQFCDRAIWLDHGAVAMDGEARSVIAAYTAALAPTQGVEAQGDADNGSERKYCVVNDLRLSSPQPVFTRGDEAAFEIEFTVLAAREYVPALAINTEDGLRLATESSLGAGHEPLRLEPGVYRRTVRLDTSTLPAGRYRVSVGLLDESLLHIDDFHTIGISIDEGSAKTMSGLVRVSVDWGDRET